MCTWHKINVEKIAEISTLIISNQMDEFWNLMEENSGMKQIKDGECEYFPKEFHWEMGWKCNFPLENHKYYLGYTLEDDTVFTFLYDEDQNNAPAFWLDNWTLVEPDYWAEIEKPNIK